MKFRYGLVLALASLAASGAMAAGVANGLIATGPASGFEVFGTSGGPRAFCGAAEYARSHLGAQPADRVVLVRPWGPSPTQPNRRSVGFALQGPQAKTDWGGGIVLRTGEYGVGQNRSVGHAQLLCDDKHRGFNEDDDD
ncbi:hypothetical protein [Tropicimonas sp.]|uniref:hypothetical protein n=1 Tax=Tropicimonas sp. TaxID=2067044 RepID=UPI003A842094